MLYRRVTSCYRFLQKLHFPNAYFFTVGAMYIILLLKKYIYYFVAIFQTAWLLTIFLYILKNIDRRKLETYCDCKTIGCLLRSNLIVKYFIYYITCKVLSNMIMLIDDKTTSLYYINIKNIFSTFNKILLFTNLYHIQFMYYKVLCRSLV